MNGVLKCSGTYITKNIGDYIQSVAQEQFWDHYECFVEREELSEFSAKESVNVIMNAWFMWKPEKFPPSPCINPLFLSFHIVPSIAPRLLSKDTINYLKKYEPIGARDTGTQKILEANNIKSYFSGCLTLTLGYRYKSKKRNSNIFFVDPYYELGGNSKLPKIIKYGNSILLYFKYRKKIQNFVENFHCEFHSLFRRFPKFEKKIMAASFYHTYSKMFEDSTLFNAKYLTHDIIQKQYPSDEEKMNYARNLIAEYAQAKFVITSRIHCGLPCLGVETPVIFVNSDALNGNSVRSSGRFGGLIDLFHVAKWTPNGVVPSSPELLEYVNGSKININYSLKNKDSYKSLKDQMIDTIKNWQEKLNE